MDQETFWSLLRDAAHWEFELFLMAIFDVVVGMIAWPFIRKAFLHHESDDSKIARLEKKVQKLEEALKAKQ